MDVLAGPSVRQKVGASACFLLISHDNSILFTYST
jgi:hypothetical protein